mgnify:CR=1 FL=1
MGLLNFLKRISENAPIETVKKETNNPYQDGNSCLQMIVDNWDVQFAGRYDVFAKVLYESQKFDDSLHYLACAYACHYSKVEYRKKAIEYFQKYLLNPVPCSNSNFPLYVIYRDLGKDYEGEYDFINAEKCYKLAIQNQGSRYYSSITKQYEAFPEEIMLGRLYLKMGTQNAIDYWAKLMKYDEYINGNPHESGFRRHVDREYKNALEKHEKGYVYRPRTKKQ